MSSLETGGGARRRSRELVLQLLFQNEFVRGGDPRQMLKVFAGHFEVPSDVLEYASELVLGIFSNLESLDGLINSGSAHWRTSRMALVDLNVMRIAAYEMCLRQPQLQPAIAIDEAVEIAKRYGSTDSGAFVNGILDQVARVHAGSKS